MGNFYTNYTLRGPSQREVAAALSGRRARVTPARNGCVVVFDEASDCQDHGLIGEFASQLSRQFACPVFAVLNHDDSIFWYQLYSNGILTDEYDSTPGYFDPAAQPSAPAGGDAAQLCNSFACHDKAAVERVLGKSSFDVDGYAFAVDRHAELVSTLGLNEYAVGTAYASFDYDELPEGLTADDVIETE